MTASARRIASLAFGGENLDPAAVTQLRHLALLPVDSLELDLSGAEQREFGDYELLERIGEGGMGVVYRARQKRLDREVAVKLLAAGPWASHEFIERFKREAQNAARMQHPNIVAIYEVGSADELQFFSMRLVRGRSLAAAIEAAGPFEPVRAARLLRTVAEAVDYAHSLGVLHLDLKPANVLLDENEEPLVADFGLARRLDDRRSADSDEVSGTPSYMAPEQADPRSHRITAATDLWGLGAILYELVAGAPPFRSVSAQETLRQLREANVPSPRRFARALPRDLEAIILKCLARNPADRYSSARALADDLGRFVEHRAVRAQPLNVLQQAERWIRREPLLAGAAITIVLALGIGLAAAATQWRRARLDASRADAVRGFLVNVFDQAAPDKDKGKSISARQLLEVGERQLGGQGRLDPSLHADLAGLLGTLYWDIGDYDHAESLLRQTLRLVASGGVADSVQARVLLQQAKVDFDQNRYDSAIAHAQRALALARHSSPSAPDLAGDAQRTIASAEIGTGLAVEADRRLRSTLADDLRRFGKASREVASDEVWLGEALVEESRFDQAVPMLRDAIAAASAAFGSGSSAALNAMDLFGRALRLQGRYAQAEAIMRKDVAGTALLYGPDSSNTLTASSNMLIAVESQGRYAEALQERLAMLPKQAKLVPNHPEILAYAYKNIASDYLALGRLHEAETAARTALSTWARIEDVSLEWNSVAARNTLALALQYQGRYAEAEHVLRKTVEIQRGHERPGSVWLNQTLGLLGNLLRLERRDAAAVAQLRSALAELPETANPVRAELQAALAEAELDAGNPAQARIDATHAMATARDSLPAGNIRFAAIDFSLARSDLAGGDAAAAMPLLDYALTLRSASLPADDPRVLEVQVERVQALAALGQAQESQALRRTLEPILDHAATSRPHARTLLQRLDPVVPTKPQAATGAPL